MDRFSSTFAIGDHQIGHGSDVYVIAEIGSNHDGSLDTALELVRAAAETGADAVKFQSFTAETLAAPSAERLQTFFRDHRLPDEWLPTLAEAARGAGIDFMSTPFHLGAVQTLADVGAPALKVASGDLTNHLLLEACAATGLPLIVSTGAAYLGDIERSLGVLADAGAHDVVVLHCTSSYPPRFADLNLRAMTTIAEAYGTRVGYSDHSLGELASIIAVTLGASVIEKHFTLDKTLEGPDHAASLDPAELHSFVASLRGVEVALGSAVKACQPIEAGNRDVVRRSIVAARKIAAGTTIEAADLECRRPASGRTAFEFWDVVGTVAEEDVAVGGYVG
jgi:sialic acid synthase SpsE